MPLPADQVKINMDQATDDPKQARQDLSNNVDKFNQLKAFLGDGVGLNVGDGLKDDGAGNLDLDFAADSGLEFFTTQLRIKLKAGGALLRAAADVGLTVDINGTTTNAGIDTLADFLLYYDTSLVALRKILPTDIIARASQAEAEAGTDNVKTMTPLRSKQSVEKFGVKPELFLASGTYNVPTGVTKVLVEVCGAGGGGGGGRGGAGAGGGGAGAWIQAEVTVTGGGSETITLGAAGTGGILNVSGTAGAASTFGTKVTAGGGGGGNTFGSGGAAGIGTSIGTLVAEGGQAGFANVAGAGGQGGGHGLTEQGGGAGGVEVSGTGGIGELSCGGGGGAKTVGTGGNGKLGYILVTPITVT